MHRRSGRAYAIVKIESGLPIDPVHTAILNIDDAYIKPPVYQRDNTIWT